MKYYAVSCSEPPNWFHLPVRGSYFFSVLFHFSRFNLKPVTVDAVNFRIKTGQCLELAC
jgi:hypothetical protein